MVGRVTSGIQSPILNYGVGYVRFNEVGDWAGKTLQLGLPDATQHDCDIVDLPFFDREKNIVRGVGRTIPE